MTTTEDSTSTTEDSATTLAGALARASNDAVTADEYRDAVFDRLRAEHESLGNRVDELLAENVALTANLEAAQQRSSELATELRQMQQRLYRVNEESEQFKRQVVEVADRYARQHDLCSVVDEALHEVGLERKRLRYRGEITFTVSFETGLVNRRDSLPETGWVETSIQTDEVMDAIRNSFEMDSDHEDTEIDDISYRVRNVREAE